MHFSTYRAKICTKTVQKKLIEAKRWQDAERKKHLLFAHKYDVSTGESASVLSLKGAILDFFITFSNKLLIWCVKGYFLYDK